MNLVLPIACAWVRKEEAVIIRTGISLSPEQMADARRIGVAQADRVRVLEVEMIPPRLHPMLRFLARKFGITFSGTIGMALGHGILIRAEYLGDRRLLLHELAHVAQYERLGRGQFLRQYLHECLTQGYPLGALEAEARQVTDSVSA